LGPSKTASLFFWKFTATNVSYPSISTEGGTVFQSATCNTEACPDVGTVRLLGDAETIDAVFYRLLYEIWPPK